MTEDLKAKCEKTFYSELYHFEESSQGLLIDETTGHIYLKKILDTYDKDVYAWLKSNRNVHIPAIHSYLEENGKLIVLEEYIQGETLESVLTRGALDGSERIRIILDVCDALSFLHSARIPIIHRDIKPSNIMLTSDGIVKLIDYDAAKVFHQGKKEDTTLIGTVGRAAPEQYGFAQSDARTDVYSMGLLIREMFPNDGRFYSLISKATAMDPNGRYQTIAELKEAVSCAVAGPAGKNKSTWRLIPVACGVFILCIAAFFIGLRAGGGRRSERMGSAAEAIASKAEETPAEKTPAEDPPEENATAETILAENAPAEETPAEEEVETQVVATADPSEDPVQVGDDSIDSSEETAGPSESEDLAIADSCWFITGSSGEGFVHYGVVLENRNKSRRVLFPTVRVTAKDKSGRVLGTDHMTGMGIRPGDHIALSSLVSLSNYKSSDDVSVEFSVVPAETAEDNDDPKSTDFVVEGITDTPYGMFPNVTGEITSQYTAPVDVAVTAMFRENGKLVGSDTTYLDGLRPGEKTAFEINLITTMPKHDSVEVMVQEW